MVPSGATVVVTGGSVVSTVVVSVVVVGGSVDGSVVGMVVSDVVISVCVVVTVVSIVTDSVGVLISIRLLLSLTNPEIILMIPMTTINATMASTTIKIVFAIPGLGRLA